MLFFFERKTRLEPTMRGHFRAFFVTPGPLKGDGVARASHRFQQT